MHSKFPTRCRKEPGKSGGHKPSMLKILRPLANSFVLILIFSLTVFSQPLPFLADSQTLLSKPLTLQWQYASEQTVNLTPATDGQRVYLPLAAGALVSLRVSNGQLLWKTDIGGELSSAPLADESGVFVASESLNETGKDSRTTGALRLLGKDSGVTLWLRPLAAPIRAALAMNQDTLFGAASDGSIYAVNKKDGAILWERKFDFTFASRMTLVGSSLYIGSEDGKLLSLDQKTGTTLWRYQTRSAIRGRIAVVAGIVYFGSADGYVYAVREMDGRLRWRARTGAGVQSVLSARNGLLVTSLDNFVYFLSLRRGNRVWKRQLAGRLAAEPLATFDGALFTPLSGDSGIVLDLKDGKPLNIISLGEDSNTAASPIVADKMVLITTRHGLLAFSSPTVVTKKQ
ncbi:MAG: PQQ-binding-like beta-propeller repeat protein [Pyrinomonadaceae bacterium]|nr:PQQ-binding-like beta-propeller repeat protein [Pyrinomonadaceae bacterium]